MTPERWQKVEDLFHASLERSPEERQAFLVERCGADAELRRDVELLLARGAQAGSFLDVSPLEDLAVAPLVASTLVGRQIGPYRVRSQLGRGGMGEVYLAHDDTLGRDVAVKTLPEEFARDPERLARFRREARTLASLNHPNIAAIYGLEESGDVECLVLELVEGETLRGPLPVAQALDYARQVAEAVEAAHEKGIIHRDLKPANVKVTPQGKVKVLDFGLAKARWEFEGEQNPSQSPGSGTRSLPGRIVGTPGYMSPEQALGRDADKQMDVWAFGCLLYELLAGKRAFQGETFTDTVAAVREREPDWLALPAKTPTKIRELLRQCLQKDAGRRLQTIADARKTIEDAQRGRNRWRGAAVAAAVLAILSVGAVAWFDRSDRPLDRSDWVQLTKFPDSVTQPALSPDGRMIAFIRGNSTFFGPGQVYVKVLPDGEPKQLTNDSLYKMSPAFSPDSTRVAYTTVDPAFAWDTWIVPAQGGTPELFLKNASGLVWTDARHVLFAEMKMGVHMGIVAADERRVGARDVYLPMAEPAMAHRSSLSPDGKWVLLVEMDEDHLWLPCRLVGMDGSSPGRAVGPPGGGCTVGAWSPDGKWMYFTTNAVGDNHIWRQRFPNGVPEQVTSGPTSEEGIAMAPDGRSFVTAMALQNASLWVHDAKGEHQIALEGNAAQPKFTPDGRKLLYRIVREPPTEFAFYRDLGEVMVVDLESGRSEPLARGLPALDYDISFDGTQVVMATEDREGKARLWLAPLDRSTPPRQIPNVEGGQPRFGLDGEIFFRYEEERAGFVYRVRQDGTGLRKALAQATLTHYDVSRDGKWLTAWAPLPGNKPPALQAFPLNGGSPVLVGSFVILHWSLDGRSSFASAFSGDTWSYILPLAGEALPVIPAGGFGSEKDVAAVPGARRIDGMGVVPGPSAEVYAFYRGTTQRNLYRIPIP